MRFLFVGLGGAGQRHLRNLYYLLGDRVKIGAWRQRGRPFIITESFQADGTRTMEDTYEIVSYRSLEEALSDKPEAAIIATPSSLHVAPALALAKGGCHVLIEKPLSNSLDGVEELIAAVEQRGLVGLVGYQMRFHPCARLVTLLVGEGAIGRVIASRVTAGSYLPDWHPYEDYRELYAARADLGGGVILTEIHELDFLYGLFGMPRCVVARGGHLSDLDLRGVEDTASLILEYDLGRYAFPAHVQLSFAQRPASRSGEIRGTLGTIEWDYIAKEVRIFRAARADWEFHRFPDFERNQMFLDLIRHFLACHRGDEKPVVSLRDGMNSLRIALAARQSMQTGTPVEVGK